MIILDTCAIVFDALAPNKLSAKAKGAIKKAAADDALSICDISLWEIAMLIQKGRLDPGTDSLSFLNLVVAARKFSVLPITPEIAVFSATHPSLKHGDPADRLIAATAMLSSFALITCDSKLLDIPDLKTVW